MLHNMNYMFTNMQADGPCIKQPPFSCYGDRERAVALRHGSSA